MKAVNLLDAYSVKPPCSGFWVFFSCSSSLSFIIDSNIQDGVEGDMWSLMNKMYNGTTFKVKWDNNVTDNINITQGIR
jgi:hypothetical protein